MLDKMITPANAITATRFLMEMDINDIQDSHKSEVLYGVLNLKQAQKDYLLSSRFTYSDSLDTVPLEDSLLKLTDCVKTLTALLSPESQASLQSWLLMNEKI